MPAPWGREGTWRSTCTSCFASPCGWWSHALPTRSASTRSAALASRRSCHDFSCPPADTLSFPAALGLVMRWVCAFSAAALLLQGGCSSGGDQGQATAPSAPSPQVERQALANLLALYQEAVVAEDSDRWQALLAPASAMASKSWRGASPGAVERADDALVWHQHVAQCAAGGQSGHGAGDRDRELERGPGSRHRDPEPALRSRVVAGRSHAVCAGFRDCRGFRQERRHTLDPDSCTACWARWMAIGALSKP